MHKLLTLFFLVGSSQLTFAKTLDQLLSEQLREVKKSPSTFQETYAYQGYVPVESMELRYGYDELDSESETYALRFKLKSFKELSVTAESQKATKALVAAENRALRNQSIYQAYRDLVESIFYLRIQKLLKHRLQEVEATINKSTLGLGLSKINPKDLIDNLEIHANLESQIQPAFKNYVDVDIADVDSLVQQLMADTKSLAVKIVDLDNQQPVEIELQSIENQLEKINKQVDWADDEKLLSFFEVRKEPVQNETSYRFGINIPWIRFDGVNKARDRALMYAKDRALQRSAQEASYELGEDKTHLKVLASQIESFQQRIQKLSGLNRRLKKLKDNELQAEMSKFVFENEIGAIILGLEFYISYLDYMREKGAFSEREGVNLLSATWNTLK